MKQQKLQKQLLRLQLVLRKLRLNRLQRLQDKSRHKYLDKCQEHPVDHQPPEERFHHNKQLLQNRLQYKLLLRFNLNQSLL